MILHMTGTDQGNTGDGHDPYSHSNINHEVKEYHSCHAGCNERTEKILGFKDDIESIARRLTAKRHMMSQVPHKTNLLGDNGEDKIRTLLGEIAIVGLRSLKIALPEGASRTDGRLTD